MDPNGFRFYITPASRSFDPWEPVIPLPAPGEGGAAYPGDDIASEPVIPLPAPGEGGAAYPGDDIASEPVIPLPGPGEGGPVYPGDDIASEPVIPLPNPGEGGPVYPGGGWGQSAQVRFLNAAYGYPALRIWVGNSRFVNRLNYAAVTGYGRVRPGYQIVTVSGVNGTRYVRKSMPFPAGGRSTIAVIRTASGLDLLQVSDCGCPASNGYASLRMGNLAYNSGPLDVVMSDGRVVYGDLRYKEVTSFRRVVPGTYQFFYADTNQVPMAASMEIERLDPAWLGVYPPYETFGSLLLNINGGESYTVYLLQKGTGRNNIQNLILEDC